MERKIINLSDFQVLKHIGEGSFGDVYQIKNKTTNKMYAAKILKNQISSDYLHNEETLLFFREVKLLSILNHPSFIRFKGYSSVNFEQLPYPTIITQFASNGTLKDIIKSESLGLSPKGWDETKKLINIYGIAEGLKYLHYNNIIHRDLKLENILLDDNLYPKISDFGLIKSIKSESKSFQVESMKNLKGTPIYMPPESIMNMIYSKPGDVFAFALIVYQIWTTHSPYSFANMNELLSNVIINDKRPELTSDIPVQFQELIEKCWRKDPKDRPTFDEIVDDLSNNSNYITDNINESEYFEYIDYIKNCKSSFDIEQSIKFDDLVNKCSITSNKSDFDQQAINMTNNDDDNDMQIPKANDKNPDLNGKVDYPNKIVESDTQKKVRYAPKRKKKTTGTPLAT
ncbi:hypothetical protein M9Y10_032543 [Tritrichomonas musculus]|uniref:Protein kinase domain-containing protein n=1 Tax=Tritrichomonas musculus TaxID=1915356 RepID=A0ABR2GYR4_9EUKA